MPGALYLAQKINFDSINSIIPNLIDSISQRYNVTGEGLMKIVKDLMQNNMMSNYKNN